MKVPRTAVVGVVTACLEVEAKRATKYLAVDQVVRATRRDWYDGKPPRKGARTVEVVLTIGKPNYRERQYIKLLKAAGEPFPVKNIQLKW